MSNAPAFQFYPNDFLCSTIDWEIDEVGAYIRLLCAQWKHGPLPNDIDRLSRICGCSPKRMKKVIGKIEKSFTQTDDNKLINERLERTRQEQNEYREKQREYGKLGVKVREENKKKVVKLCQG